MSTEVLKRYVEQGSEGERATFRSLLKEVDGGNRTAVKEIQKRMKSSSGCAAWEATAAQWILDHKGAVPNNIRGINTIFDRMVREAAEGNPFVAEVRADQDGAVDWNDPAFQAPAGIEGGDLAGNPAAPVAEEGALVLATDISDFGRRLLGMRQELEVLLSRARAFSDEKLDGKRLDNIEDIDVQVIAMFKALIDSVGPAELSDAIRVFVENYFMGGDLGREVYTAIVCVPEMLGTGLQTILQAALAEAIGWPERTGETTFTGEPRLHNHRDLIFEAASWVLRNQQRDAALANLQQLVAAATDGTAPSFLRTSVRTVPGAPEESVIFGYFGKPEYFEAMGFTLPIFSTLDVPQAAAERSPSAEQTAAVPKDEGEGKRPPKASGKKDAPTPGGQDGGAS